MGLFDLFARDAPCPRCGNQGARRGLFGTVKCPNRACECFDANLMHQREEALRMEEAIAAGKLRRYRNPRTGRKIYKEVPGDFDPGEHRIEVRYLNFRAESKTFEGDWRTLRHRSKYVRSGREYVLRPSKHISLQVRPTGTRIALAIDRIQNIADIEEALGRCPTTPERRVLAYHARRGTTSERCEQLRRKYPDWSPPN